MVELLVAIFLIAIAFCLFKCGYHLGKSQGIRETKHLIGSTDRALRHEWNAVLLDIYNEVKQKYPLVYVEQMERPEGITRSE